MVAVLCELMWPSRHYFMQYDDHGLVNLRERILVVNSDFIELVVINVHPKGPIILLTNKTRTPHGEILGLRKPLSSKYLI